LCSQWLPKATHPPNTHGGCPCGTAPPPGICTGGGRAPEGQVATLEAEAADLREHAAAREAEGRIAAAEAEPPAPFLCPEVGGGREEDGRIGKGGK